MTTDGAKDLPAHRHLRSLQERRREVSAQLEQVDAELASLRRDREDRSDDDEHDPEGVPLSVQWSELEGRREAKVTALQDVDAAIARLQAGTGGICERCGGPIAPARLAVRPEATTCIDCAD